MYDSDITRYWIALVGFALAPRLEDPADRTAFLLWFRYLAEAQYYGEPMQRPAEIQDCASLLRYAYRETFSKHDAAWIERNRLPGVPALPAIRTMSGPMFITPEGLRHFADAKTLMRENCVRVGDRMERARPGDLLFFEQVDQPGNWHVMIYLGPSQIEPDGERYVLYHTGPVNRRAGEIRKLRVSELMGHPQPRWRPVPGNNAFKGVFRWKILEG